MKSPNNDNLKGMGADGQNNCPKCGKRIASKEQAGELASHLFQDFNCSCGAKDQAQSGANSKQTFIPANVLQKLSTLGSTTKPGKKSEPLKDNQGQNENDDFCPRCGLTIAGTSLPGSLTGYLFQDIRCKCAPEADFAKGAMSGKLWQLKKAGMGKTFSSLGQEEKSHTDSTINLAGGAIIGGAYRIIELIGRGGMGEVYLAEQIALGKKCALKLIPPEQVTELGWRRFQQEAKAIAKLEHINLVKVSDLGIHEGCLPFYAMEFVQGHTLADMLAQYGPMPLKTCIEIFTQICDGVDHAHRAGIIHRDLKPANIMVSKTAGGKLAVKVLDFGLAKLTQQDRDKQSLTSVGDIFGSPYYMSPEQCIGAKIDNRSDIYSIGCTLFECLTGQPPFTGQLSTSIIFSHMETDPPSLESIVGPKTFPESIEVVMAKLLRKNPVERYQTFSELRGDLEKVARGEAVLPFYMSRAKGGGDAGQINPTRSPNTKPTGTSNSKGVNLIWIALILTLVGTATLTYYFLSHKPAPTPVRTTIANDFDQNLAYFVPEREAQNEHHQITTRADIIMQTDPLSRPATSHLDADKRFVTFEFPDTYVGQLSWNERPADPAGFTDAQKDARRIIAQGIVKVPAGADVTFTIKRELNSEAWKHPNFISKLGCVWIKGFCINAAPNQWDYIGTEADKKADAQQTNKLITAVCDWPNLTKLQLNGCQTTDEALLALDKCTRLIQFAAGYTSLNGKLLAQRPFIKNLQSLSLSSETQTDAVLAQLKGSTAIREVVLHHTDCTPQGLMALASCPNLVYLYMVQSSTNAQIIDAISTIKSLKYLVIIGHHIKPDRMPQLAKLNKIDSVTFEATRWSPADRKSAQSMIPHIIFAQLKDNESE